MPATFPSPLGGARCAVSCWIVRPFISCNDDDKARDTLLPRGARYLFAPSPGANFLSSRSSAAKLLDLCFSGLAGRVSSTLWQLLLLPGQAFLLASRPLGYLRVPSCMPWSSPCASGCRDSAKELSLPPLCPSGLLKHSPATLWSADGGSRDAKGTCFHPWQTCPSRAWPPAFGSALSLPPVSENVPSASWTSL